MPETSKLLTEGEKKWLGELDAKYRDVDYTKLGGKLMFSVSSNAKIVKIVSYNIKNTRYTKLG